MGIALATSMLLMVLCGPALAPNRAMGVSCMGPVLAPMHTTDGLAWAQCCPPQHATDDLVWAHPWSQRMLQMVLHGPSASAMECYGWSCMVRSLAQSVLPMILHGPSARRPAC